MKKLIAIDGNSLMHRAYYALPSMTAHDGTPTGAVYGFVSMLLKLLDYKPDYMLAAFDMHGPTFRHEQYGEYKAGRRPTPEDLKAQFPLIKELLKDMGIAVCECPRYEADDILGTFARMANGAGTEALLVTGDRDALQLVGGHTHVLLTKKGITDTVEYDEAALMERYGLTPERMPDLKGLMGDSSDNLPGVPGVGEKTALKLLGKYGTLENTLANAKNEKGALQKKLMENGDSARLSYRLGIIDVNAPVAMGLEDCAFAPGRMAGAVPMMQRLELRSLIQRLPEGRAPFGETGDTKLKTIKVSDAESLEGLVKKLAGAKSLAIEIGEGMSAALESGEQYDISLEGTLLEPGLSREEVFSALKPALENGGTDKCLFDSKGARHILGRAGIELKGRVFDAMIADYLLHSIHPADTLPTLCAERGLENGAAPLLALRSEMTGELRSKGMLKLYEDVELPLTKVLFDMEKTGFAIDTAVLGELSEQFTRRIGATEAEIYSLAGEGFNILSTKQLGGILFEKLGLPHRRKTKTGYSTDAEVLESLSDKHPIVPLVLEYRFLAKLKSTFIDGLAALVRDGRIHTSFNQNVTATGRISSTEPNLQNIPVRTEQGREIRRAFIASPGSVLVGADYSQIELRLLAHMSGDPGFIKAFNSGEDIHARTASEVFGVPLDEVTREQRSAAKAVNFGIVYGISDFGLARNLGVTRRAAGEYIARYFERYPGVREYMRLSVERGRNQGYVSTLMGRRRELPEISSSNFNTRSFGERVAMNMPIQGAAADIIKLAMVNIHRELSRRGLNSKLILQIHDELIIDAPYSEEQEVRSILSDCMQNAVKLNVPLVAQVSSGHSWYDTK